MLPTTQRKTIDYDAIYTGLLEFVNRHSADDIASYGFASPAQELREFRTIGVTSPRQCGKTQWLIKMLNEDPDTSAVFNNKDFLNHAKQYMVNVDDSRLFTAWDIIAAKMKMTDGKKNYPVIQTRKVFVDDAFRTLETIGASKFYKWAAKGTYASELIVVNVG